MKTRSNTTQGKLDKARDDRIAALEAALEKLKNWPLFPVNIDNRNELVKRVREFAARALEDK